MWQIRSPGCFCLGHRLKALLLPSRLHGILTWSAKAPSRILSENTVFVLPFILIALTYEFTYWFTYNLLFCIMITFFVLHYIKWIFKFILRGNHKCGTSSRMLFWLSNSVEFGIIFTLMCSFSEGSISLLHLFSYFAPIIVETFQLFILDFVSFRSLLMTLYCEQWALWYYKSKPTLFY